MNNNESKYILKIDSFNKRFLSFSHRIDDTFSSATFRKKRIVIISITLLLYTTFMSIVSFFHEPWSDESQSWAIAKYASYHDMLFFLGHGEGHPPLWWIYLSLFAKIGVPYELGLKMASIILNVIFSLLLLIKVKIPVLIKFSVPFTYFFFYQYGVISRCYSILILSLVLLAIFWNDRNIKPYKTSFSLILLSLSSAYGLVISFALALLWVYELLKKSFKDCNDKNFFFIHLIKYNKKQINALLMLLFSSVITVVLLFPTNDPYALVDEKKNTLLFRIFYMLIIEPIDSLFFISEYIDTELYSYSPDYYSLIVGSFIAIIFYLTLFFWPKARNMRRFIILPHIILSIIAATTFYWSHHIGITTSLFLFWYIICYTKTDTPYVNSNSLFLKKAEIWMDSSEGQIIQRIYWLIPTFIIIISIKWSIDSSFSDIKYNYSANREIYNTIIDIGGKNSKILTSDIASATSYLGDNNNVYKLYVNDHYMSFAVNNLTPSQKDIFLEKWSLIGWPDFYIDDSSWILGYIKKQNPYLESPPEYTLLKSVDYGTIFKGEYCGIDGWTQCNLYIRKELLNN